MKIFLLNILEKRFGEKSPGQPTKTQTIYLIEKKGQTLKSKETYEI